MGEGGLQLGFPVTSPLAEGLGPDPFLIEIQKGKRHLKMMGFYGFNGQN